MPDRRRHAGRIIRGIFRTNVMAVGIAEGKGQGQSDAPRFRSAGGRDLAPGLREDGKGGGAPGPRPEVKEITVSTKPERSAQPFFDSFRPFGAVHAGPSRPPAGGQAARPVPDRRHLCLPVVPADPVTPRRFCDPRPTAARGMEVAPGATRTPGRIDEHSRLDRPPPPHRSLAMRPFPRRGGISMRPVLNASDRRARSFFKGPISLRSSGEGTGIERAASPSLRPAGHPRLRTFGVILTVISLPSRIRPKAMGRSML